MPPSSSTCKVPVDSIVHSPSRITVRWVQVSRGTCMKRETRLVALSEGGGQGNAFLASRPPPVYVGSPAEDAVGVSRYVTRGAQSGCIKCSHEVCRAFGRGRRKVRGEVQTFLAEPRLPSTDSPESHVIIILIKGHVWPIDCDGTVIALQRASCLEASWPVVKWWGIFLLVRLLRNPYLHSCKFAIHHTH